MEPPEPLLEELWLSEEMALEPLLLHPFVALEESC